MMMAHISAGDLVEQAMIADFLVRNGGPSTAPNWGVLQPLYDLFRAHGHALVRLIDNPGLPATYELDEERVIGKTVIALARRLGMQLSDDQLAAISARPPLPKSSKSRDEQALYRLLVSLAEGDEERPSNLVLRTLVGTSRSGLTRALRRLQDDGRVRVGPGSPNRPGRIEICATRARTRAYHG